MEGKTMHKGLGVEGSLVRVPGREQRSSYLGSLPWGMLEKSG